MHLKPLGCEYVTQMHACHEVFILNFYLRSESAMKSKLEKTAEIKRLLSELMTIKKYVFSTKQQRAHEYCSLLSPLKVIFLETMKP